MRLNTNIAYKIKSFPKIILHTHLEGSTPSNGIYLLSQRNRINLSFDPFNKNLYKQIEARNWNSFRKIFFEICSCFVTKQDFYESLLLYGLKLKSENVIYAEVQFSPWKHISRGVKLDEISNGLICAIEELQNKHGIIVKMICDLVRHKDENCDNIIDWLTELPRKYFVAIGISGGSNAVERRHYNKYCVKAKMQNLKITAHAGEIEGAESIKEIIDHFYVDRIGHGIRCIENTELLNILISKKFLFEICPTANKIIGVCRDNFSPIREMISSGIIFSINTDDELIFNTNIIKEYQILINEKIINIDKILDIQKDALTHSFANNETKDYLLRNYFS